MLIHNTCDFFLHILLEIIFVNALRNQYVHVLLNKIQLVFTGISLMICKLHSLSSHELSLQLFHIPSYVMIGYRETTNGLFYGSSLNLLNICPPLHAMIFGRRFISVCIILMISNDSMILFFWFSRPLESQTRFPYFQRGTPYLAIGS